MQNLEDSLNKEFEDEENVKGSKQKNKKKKKKHLVVFMF